MHCTWGVLRGGPEVRGAEGSDSSILGHSDPPAAPLCTSVQAPMQPRAHERPLGPSARAPGSLCKRARELHQDQVLDVPEKIPESALDADFGFRHLGGVSASQTNRCTVLREGKKEDQRFLIMVYLLGMTQETLMEERTIFASALAAPAHPPHTTPPQAGKEPKRMELEGPISRNHQLSHQLNRKNLVCDLSKLKDI